MMTAEAPSSGGDGSSSPSKMRIVPKFNQIYTTLFQGNLAITEKPQFWDELFLLKVNAEHLKMSIAAMENDRLVSLKNVFNEIFVHCCEILHDDSEIRVVNSLLTMAVIFREVFRKKFANFGFDVVNILMGFDKAQERSGELLVALERLLSHDSLVVRNLVFKLLIVMATATENINQNTLMEYFMMHDMFDSLIQVFRDTTQRVQHGFDVLFLLAALVNYRKYETPNIYFKKLSDLSDDVVLHSIGFVVQSVFTERNRRWSSHLQTGQSQGFMQQLSSLVGNMFVSHEDTEVVKTNLSRTSAVLLSLYQIVYLNDSFINVLTHTPTTSASTELDKSSGAPEENPTTNLLSTFFTFTSFVIADKDVDAPMFTKLCFHVLICVTEDSQANAYLHDANVHVPVLLHRAAMRHRPATNECSSRGPLAGALLDLIIEYLVSHLRKSIDIDLYSNALGVIHRLLCYQKQRRIRLTYKWKVLWAALVSLVNFVLFHEKDLDNVGQVLGLASQVICIFNLFITYGDTFLPDPNSYDDLYYELIRVHTTFDNLYDTAKRHVREHKQWHTIAANIASNLVNIRAITHHFTPKIDQWAIANHVSTLTPEQVLTVVRENYDTLTLKLQDNLDHYEKYSENPGELLFYTQVVRTVISANTKHIDLSGPLYQPKS